MKLNFLASLSKGDDVEIISTRETDECLGMVDVSSMVDYDALKMQLPCYLSVDDCNSIACYLTGRLNKKITIAHVVKNIFK